MAAVILVVDDDDPVRIMLGRLLQTRGHTIVQAANAPEARKLLESQPVDLVVSDIVMPGESGIELRRTIAAQWPNLPVILISGYSPEGPAEFAAKTPLTWFVQKPFVVTGKLLDVVDDALAAGGGAADASPAV